MGALISQRDLEAGLEVALLHWYLTVWLGVSQADTELVLLCCWLHEHSECTSCGCMKAGAKLPKKASEDGQRGQAESSHGASELHGVRDRLT